MCIYVYLMFFSNNLDKKANIFAFLMYGYYETEMLLKYRWYLGKCQRRCSAFNMSQRSQSSLSYVTLSAFTTNLSLFVILSRNPKSKYKSPTFTKAMFTFCTNSSIFLHCPQTAHYLSYQSDDFDCFIHIGRCLWCKFHRSWTLDGLGYNFGRWILLGLMIILRTEVTLCTKEFMVLLGIHSVRPCASWVHWWWTE